MLNLYEYKTTRPIRFTANVNFQSKPLRIVLYSHDTMGLGHKRRNILIAQTLAASHLSTEILLITGSQTASDFQKMPGLDCLSLPELYKSSDGIYQSKNLNFSFEKITKLRAKIIKEAVMEFDPHIFIADNIPRGVGKELNPTLKYFRSREKTHCILGLRDILDRPEVVAHDWQKAKNEKAIRKFYHEIWVYGDAQIYDIRQEYSFSQEIVRKINYVGYLDQRLRLQYSRFDTQKVLRDLGIPTGKFVLCLLGGGQDGNKLAQAFARSSLPKNMNGIIVTGPFMASEERQKLHEYAAQIDNLFVVDYLREPTILLREAERVIAMGGYNTTCEILSFQKKALILPRIKPRLEQFIRASLLQNLGLVDMIHPDKVNSENLTQWLHREQIDDRHYPVDFNGCNRLVTMIENRYLVSQMSA